MPKKILLIGTWYRLDSSFKRENGISELSFSYLDNVWKCTSAALAASLLVNPALTRAAFNDIADYFGVLKSTIDPRYGEIPKNLIPVKKYRQIPVLGEIACGDPILAEENIDIRSIDKIASIDIKSNEKAILDLAVNLNCDLVFFSSQEIAKVEHKYEGSDFVKKSTGVAAVSEPVIELAGGNIIVKKIKRDGITLAIGELN